MWFAFCTPAWLVYSMYSIIVTVKFLLSYSGFTLWITLFYVWVSLNADIGQCNIDFPPYICVPWFIHAVNWMPSQLHTFTITSYITGKRYRLRMITHILVHGFSLTSLTWCFKIKMQSTLTFICWWLCTTWLKYVDCVVVFVFKAALVFSMVNQGEEDSF